ncbi:MAG: dephospho-CoA kinase [Calditrichales bacterium]|nr:MAG: dephospho-CoA kinase [Calditrichales bacterium]
MIMKRYQKYINPKIIAVTGGIGSGQSTVCSFFEEDGCKIINVDLKARQIIQKDLSLQRDLKNTFGKEIFFKDGVLNRKQLASIAFQNEEQTLLLNKLVHPRMVSQVIEEMETARFSQKYPLIIIDAALIYEISIEQMFDAIIVVFANLENRVSRVMSRDGLKKSDILARVHRQIPLDDKRKWADYVIDNNGELDDLKKQTNKIFEELTADVRTASRIRV